MEDLEKQVARSRPPRICLNVATQRTNLAVALLTALCMTFTILFAYDSSLENPFLSTFMSKTPERNILILNLALQISLFLLAELTLSVFEAARWALACRSSGTTALNFLTLSRATGFIGAVYLFCGKSGIRGRNDHQIWGFQRYESQKIGFGI